jgi:predicted DNA-binding mobile mystery protein A
MKNDERRLQREQLDRKIAVFAKFPEIPPKGWIHGIRMSLKITFKQLGKRMGITPQSVMEIVNREADGSVSLKTLRDVGSALGMKLVYGFVPRDGSLKKMIERQAIEVAKEIVMRTNRTMELENQAVNRTRIEKAIQEQAKDIIEQMPPILWNLT